VARVIDGQEQHVDPAQPSQNWRGELSTVVAHVQRAEAVSELNYPHRVGHRGPSDRPGRVRGGRVLIRHSGQAKRTATPRALLALCVAEGSCAPPQHNHMLAALSGLVYGIVIEVRVS
jgi:hypothetical protein